MKFLLLRRPEANAGGSGTNLGFSVTTENPDDVALIRKKVICCLKYSFSD